MERRQKTTAYLLEHCARYPALQPQDLLKALHQSVFGCGHFVTDTEDGIRRIREELQALPPHADGDVVEELDGAFCRVHLRNGTGLTAETLFRLFALSAETPRNGAEALEEKLAVLLELAERGQVPFSCAELSRAVEDWRRAGFPAYHHSEQFRAAYAPAYRVIRRDYAHLLPLLAAIDRKRAERDRVLVAIEGGSASGKTTLAALLERVYDCNVFHMDDFFLQPEQRTAERLAEPGGNVDRERFLEEVLLPLTRSETVAYRRYDCRTQTVGRPEAMVPKALNIVEGAYSMHPALAEHYDLSAFLRITPELQRARISVRNTPESAERFFTMWVPLERRYFEAMDPEGRCDLVLEADG